MDDQYFKTTPSLAELYPHLTPEELIEAEKNLDDYLDLMVEMFSRIKSDPEAYARFRALTAPGAYPTIEGKKQNFQDPSEQ